jgi:hypothetical protein
VQHYEYSSIRQVGKEGAFEFWFLVQHADAYPDFQRKVLRLMQREVAKQNAAARNYVYLTDLVVENAGQLQEYGTQVRFTDQSGSPVVARPSTCQSTPRRYWDGTAGGLLKIDQLSEERA